MQTTTKHELRCKQLAKRAQHVFFNVQHMNAKAEKNKKELEELKEGIRILMEAFPNHEFVIGGDTNVFVK